ncbi:hypothetical protein EDB81DRAFT_693305 [Dactylonectria macrodidyma]|uniref:Uncharacterized protein n=1 Tax=Dactylonectria macrodidyma TaxID=307937 RepID=A0A9P9EFR1_9HYPO|nr:hypothetical protein EDB81DRAFT_693305 [Dactylonectria macrodidyma]
MPSGLGFVGGFVVDDIDKYFLAFDIGSNPKETLIKIQMTQLDAGKVINLVNAVAQVDIAKPKHELIRFEDVNIYASPIGCIVGTQEFPPGFVVKGKAYILDKMVRIDCRIGNQGLKLEGEIEGFSLGPLTVRGGKRLDGTRAENAIINLEITKERQHFDLSGSIALWGLETSVYVLAEAMPNPQLEFNFELGWSELLKFQVNGKLVKPAGDEKALTNLDNADFVVHAVLEQNILSEISEAMQKWFKSAQVSVHEGVEEAKRKVDQAKIEFERKCEMAQAEVRRAKDAFEAEMKVVESAFLEKEAACEKARIDNELWIIQEEKRADREIANAKGALDASQKAFENDMEAKKRALIEKQRQGDEAIGSALRDLQDKRISLQRTFGSAIDALESARRSVRDEEGELVRNAMMEEVRG